MSKIPLTQGQVALVDDDDYEYLSKFKWYATKDKNGYYYAKRMSKMINGKRHSVIMHRVINKTPDDKITDHIDRNTLNNQKYNLRSVNFSENNMNRNQQHENTCGYTWRERKLKYEAQIKANNKVIFLGLFNTPQEARQAYLKARKIYHKIGRNT